VDHLRARIQGEAEETARPLTITHHNTQQWLDRARQAREHAVAWKPDIGALEPGLIKRFSSAIAGRVQRLRLISIRRQPAVPATAWESELELTLPLGSVSQEGQVIERIPSVNAPQGASLFTAGQPIEPFKPSAIPAQSPRPVASAKPKRKPASKPLPPQARLYTRVEEISPHGETPEQETRQPSPLITPAMPQPADEKPTAPPTPARSPSMPPETIVPPWVAAPPIAQDRRQPELPPVTASPEMPRVMPRRPRPTLLPPVQRAAVSDEISASPKPAPSTPLAPEIQPQHPVAAMPPVTEQAAAAEVITPPLSHPVTAPIIQRTAETAGPHPEQPQPAVAALPAAKPVAPAPAATQPAVAAFPAAKPAAPAPAATQLPRAVAEQPTTEQPTQPPLPRALPIESPTPLAQPARRITLSPLPHPTTEPGERPQLEPPAALPRPRRLVTPTAEPRAIRQTEALPTPRRPAPATPAEHLITADFPPQGEERRVMEPPAGQRQAPTAPLPSPTAVKPLSAEIIPPEPQRPIPNPAMDLTTPVAPETQLAEASRAAGAPSPLPTAPSPISELPLHQVIRRRVDWRNRGLLRTPASLLTLRPMARVQPLVMSAADKMHVRPTPDESQRPWPMAASPTLYTHSPNLYIGPGPAPTVMQAHARLQTQKRIPGDRSTPQPPTDRHMMLSTPPPQEESLILPLPPQPIPARPPVSAPGAVVTVPESVERPTAMPLVRQQTAPSSPQPSRPPEQTVEPVAQPSMVRELIQRDIQEPSAAEEAAAPEPVDLEKLAHEVYPFVKRLIAIERERMAR